MFTGVLLTNKKNFNKGDKVKGIIDRFEGNYAVVELDDGEIINVDKIRTIIENKLLIFAFYVDWIILL